MKKTDSKHRLYELLDVLNISQSEFCRRCGLNKSALSNYLNGDREPRQDKLAIIADAFNVSPSWLMGYDVPMRAETRPTGITPTEYEMILAFRSADAGTQSAILKLLDITKNASVLDA